MLVVGGDFNVGGLRGVALWDGRNWFSIGGGVKGTVRAMTVAENGDLVVGGAFASALDAHGGSILMANIARWSIANGEWSSPGGGAKDLASGAPVVMALATVSGGFVAGGTFDTATNIVGGAPSDITVNNIARWDDSASSWSALGGGLTDNGDDELFLVSSFVVLNRGTSNETLVAAGEFLNAHNIDPAATLPVSFIARWDGAVWSVFNGRDPDDPTNDEINALAVLTDGSVVAGGEFTAIEGVSCSAIATFAAGQTLPRTWSAPSSGLVPVDEQGVFTLLPLPGGDFIAGGNFTQTSDISGLALNGVARFHSSSQTWSQMGPSSGPGFNVTVTSSVRAFAIMPDGTIYAGGNFSAANGVLTGNVARWTGTEWVGVFGERSLNVVGFDNGAGGVSGGAITAIAPFSYTVRSSVQVKQGVVVAGSFDTAGGVSGLNHVARFDGASWHALGTGITAVDADGNPMAAYVYALAADAMGHIVVGGQFNRAGGVVVNNIAVWDDMAHTWSAMDGGINGIVYALVYNTVDQTFYAGGSFGAKVWDASTTTWTALDSLGGTVYALAGMPFS
jgi:hypothetical protein